MDEDTTIVDDAREQADFDAGFTSKPAEKPPEQTEKTKPAESPRTEDAPAPEYVQITKADWAEVRAAAAKTASYDQQLSKAFGTIGNLQKVINTLQSGTPRGTRVDIPKDAFADLEKDFPELAQQTRAALERALSGVTGTGSGSAEVDDSRIERMLTERARVMEIEALEDAHPDWRTIVGAVNATTERPDPDNAFRKWLSTKDDAYQKRINGTESAAVISRSIGLFQRETKAPANPQTPAARTAREERIRDAVQPRGDGAAPAAGKSDEDEFAAGFNSR